MPKPHVDRKDRERRKHREHVRRKQGTTNNLFPRRQFPPKESHTDRDKGRRNVRPNSPINISSGKVNKNLNSEKPKPHVDRKDRERRKHREHVRRKQGTTNNLFPRRQSPPKKSYPKKDEGRRVLRPNSPINIPRGKVNKDLNSEKPKPHFDRKHRDHVRRKQGTTNNLFPRRQFPLKESHTERDKGRRNVRPNSPINISSGKVNKDLNSEKPKPRVDRKDRERRKHREPVRRKQGTTNNMFPRRQSSPKKSHPERDEGRRVLRPNSPLNIPRGRMDQHANSRKPKSHFDRKDKVPVRRKQGTTNNMFPRRQVPPKESHPERDEGRRNLRPNSPLNIPRGRMDQHTNSRKPKSHFDRKDREPARRKQSTTNNLFPRRQWQHKMPHLERDGQRRDLSPHSPIHDGRRARTRPETTRKYSRRRQSFNRPPRTMPPLNTRENNIRKRGRKRKPKGHLQDDRWKSKRLRNRKKPKRLLKTHSRKRPDKKRFKKRFKKRSRKPHSKYGSPSNRKQKGNFKRKRPTGNKRIEKKFTKKLKKHLQKMKSKSKKSRNRHRNLKYIRKKERGIPNRKRFVRKRQRFTKKYPRKRKEFNRVQKKFPRHIKIRKGLIRNIHQKKLRRGTPGTNIGKRKRRFPKIYGKQLTNWKKQFNTNQQPNKQIRKNKKKRKSKRRKWKTNLRKKTKKKRRKNIKSPKQTRRPNMNNKNKFITTRKPEGNFSVRPFTTKRNGNSPTTPTPIKSNLLLVAQEPSVNKVTQCPCNDQSKVQIKDGNESLNKPGKTILEESNKAILEESNKAILEESNKAHVIPSLMTRIIIPVKYTPTMHPTVILPIIHQGATLPVIYKTEEQRTVAYSTEYTKGTMTYDLTSSVSTEGTEEPYTSSLLSIFTSVTGYNTQEDTSTEFSTESLSVTSHATNENLFTSTDVTATTEGRDTTTETIIGTFPPPMKPTQYTLKPVIKVPTRPPCRSKYDYHELIRKSLLFYEAQRSGKLPARKRIFWRSDSGVLDGRDHNVDLLGGYYNGGYHLKLNFPQAAATTLLVWGMIESSEVYKRSGEYINGLNTVKWATDYFIKCSTGNKRFSSLSSFQLVYSSICYYFCICKNV